MTVLGNPMSLRELAEMIQRVQNGETTIGDEFVRNYTVSPGEFSQDDINRIYTDIGGEGL